MFKTDALVNRHINFWDLEIANTLNIKGYLVTLDIEKAFDWLNHSLLTAVLKILDLVIAF